MKLSMRKEQRSMRKERRRRVRSRNVLRRNIRMWDWYDKRRERERREDRGDEPESVLDVGESIFLDLRGEGREGVICMIEGRRGVCEGR